ncbi:RHS repeat-associated core domain-containing protein [Cyanobacterium aponinum UTEX 3222]|uniref:RHS repeat domain-containing protein n=1 Tax=Cyanobacterium aponinum TaxID=379064 RepID=UPI002B4BC62F|nr:RHS repeat-associated core domain-containing protein [Cyanobacterium aponinum]WRL38039.1 RHS repeat-associated core domain-containing protein [Cyanobacterium aponinum UTEX 3221]WRL41478.1 RHS repeat-associated core domain-containing protein [Cyanobacterium aponinum UTEX 3222]
MEWDYLNRLVAVTDFDSSGNILQAVELDMRYLHGNQVDEVLAQENGDGNVVWLLTDHLGTIRDLVDNTGDVVNHLTYDSYGNVVSETNSAVDSRYRFTGREWDEEIELYYYRARYYSGQTGRFISVDPISFESDTYNLYGYVDNNPISNVDPSGLASRQLTRLLNTFEPSTISTGKGKSVYQSKKVYKDYATALSRAVIAFKRITTSQYISSGPLDSRFPPDAWRLTFVLKVNGNFAKLNTGEVEGGQASLRPVGLSGPIPTIDLQPTKITRRIASRHHTAGYENVTELKFRWNNKRNLTNFCITMPVIPIINNQQTQPQSPPTFQFPPIPPIPRWLNPFRNPVF